MMHHYHYHSHQSSKLFPLILLTILALFLLITSSPPLYNSRSSTSIVSAQSVAPDGWTCDAALYDAGDGICNCLCGIVDPDCFSNPNMTIDDNNSTVIVNPAMTNMTTVGCPCASMTCTTEALCHGVCNKKDYDKLLARTDFVEILTIINTVLILLLLIVVVSLIAIRLFEDQVAAKKFRDQSVVEEGLLDDVTNLVNHVLSLGGRCHKIPAIPTRKDRVARYEAKLLLEEAKGH